MSRCANTNGDLIFPEIVMKERGLSFLATTQAWLKSKGLLCHFPQAEPPQIPVQAYWSTPTVPNPNIANTNR